MATKTSQEELLAKITKHHAEYDANLAKWQQNLDAYGGTGGFSNGSYLIKYPAEQDAKFTLRKSAAYYYNFCKTISDAFNGAIYKKKIIRDGNDNLKEFWNSCDYSRQKDMDSFMKQVQLYANNIGHCFVMVDSPKNEAQNRLQEIENGIRPYVYLLSPTVVYDWGIDNITKELTFIKILEPIMSNPDDPLADHTIVNQYRIWSKNKWELYDAEGSLIDSGINTLGIVPVVVVYNEQTPGSLIGVSEINEISDICKALYNKLSERDYILKSQGFAILCLPGDAPAAGETLTIETNGVYYYKVENGTPSFIAPPFTSVESYDRAIKDHIEIMFQLARLRATGGVMPSGVSLKFQFEQTNQSLIKKAGHLRDAELQIAKIVNLINGNDNKTKATIISYPKDYSVDDIVTELENAFRVISMKMGITFNTEYKKSMVNKLLPDATDDIIEKIKSEIEALQNEQAIDKTKNDEATNTERPQTDPVDQLQGNIGYVNDENGNNIPIKKRTKTS